MPNRKPYLTEDFIREHGTSNTDLVDAAQKIGVTITYAYAAMKRSLLGMSGKSGRKQSKKTEIVVEFLEKHPYAAGERGAVLFNNDPYFLGKYGTITAGTINDIRRRYRKKLSLPDARGHNSRPERHQEMPELEVIENPPVEEEPELVIYRIPNAPQSEIQIEELERKTPSWMWGYGRRDEYVVPNEFWERMIIEGWPNESIRSELAREYGDADVSEIYMSRMLSRAKQRIRNRIALEESKKSEKPVGNPLPPYVPPVDEQESANLDDVVTLPKFVKAVMVTQKGMGAEEAAGIVNDVFPFFGMDIRVVDNVLKKDDRINFYTMEEMGLLTTEHEEIYLVKGKLWRIKWWLLKKREILNMAKAFDAAKTESTSSTQVL